MSSFDFIQSRMARLDSYIKGIENDFVQKLGTNKKTSNGFEEILGSKLGFKKVSDIKANSSFKTHINKDDFSKLPSDFEDFLENTTFEISSQYGVELNSNLVKSVIKQESGFNPEARSHVGAQGLMQLMPSTAKSLGVHNSANPYQNLKGGITYLAQQLQSFDGDIQKALAAYNAGPTAVKKYNGIPPYQETQNYVENIMRDYLARENYQSYDLLG